MVTQTDNVVNFIVNFLTQVELLAQPVDFSLHDQLVLAVDQDGHFLRAHVDVDFVEIVKENVFGEEDA